MCSLRWAAAVTSQAQIVHVDRIELLNFFHVFVYAAATCQFVAIAAFIT